MTAESLDDDLSDGGRSNATAMTSMTNRDAFDANRSTRARPGEGHMKHLTNLDCNQQTADGNLGNFEHHSRKWLGDHGHEPKYSGVDYLRFAYPAKAHAQAGRASDVIFFFAI